MAPRAASASARSAPSAPSTLIRLVAVVACLAAGVAGCRDAGQPRPVEDAVAKGPFDAPAAVLYDSAADVWLVANLGGAPLDKNRGGHIARVSPEGEVLAARWIDGARHGTVLHAPQGMAFNGEMLVVADIDCLRMFDRHSGQQIGAACVYGSSSLVDVAVGADGRLYATDAGLRAAPDRQLPTGGDALYVLDPEEGPVRLVEGEALGRPGGLAADAAGLLVATTAGERVLRIGYDGGITTVATVPGGSLGGLVLRPDGTLLVSAAEGAAVFRLDPASGAADPLVEALGTTGLIGYDPGRSVVAIPVPARNAVVFRNLGRR
jgi:hypothetical protein